MTNDELPKVIAKAWEKTTLETLDWLPAQVMFLTKRIYALEKALAENGIVEPLENAERFHKMMLAERNVDGQAYS